MTTYSKVGFHGAGPGIGDYMRALDTAGIPFRVKSISNGGFAVEAADLSRKSGLPHDIILRWPEPNGRGNDHPILGMDPVDSARELYLGWIQPQINKTPEIYPYKDLIRIEPTNEISTKDIDPSWVGYCLLELARLLNADGWPAALGGFNNGQPELEDWKTPGMVELLKYVGANRQNTITVHEGFTTVDDMYQDPENLWPFLIGRFTYILAAADELGIARPRIEISEWGWKYDNMPSYDKALADVAWLAETLAGYPAVEAAYLWNLDEGGGQWANLPKKMAGFIPYVQAYNLEAKFPDVDGPPPDDPDLTAFAVQGAENLAGGARRAYYTEVGNWGNIRFATAADEGELQKYLYNESLKHQAIRLNAQAALQKVIYQDGFVPTEEEFRAYYEAVLPFLNLTVPISGPYAILDGGRFDAPRKYDWRPDVKQAHEGLDFSAVASGSWCLAPTDGQVVYVGYSAQGYGNYVKLKHTSPITFYTYLGHMARVDVQVGAQVKRGQRIGPAGSSGFSSGIHVHITVQVPEIGLDGYIVPDVVDPAPHFDYGQMPDPGDGGAPPAAGLALIGLHSSADPALASGELDVFTTAKVEAIKILSNLDPGDLSALKSRYPNVEWIIRAYLSMNEGGKPRLRSPFDFLTDTIYDVRRCIQRLGTEDVWIELHNEPNLVVEGLGGSWTDGATFGSWFLELLALYREQLPGASYLFPGLSPGSAITGVRAEKFGFWKYCLAAMSQADGIADHVYWGVGESVYQALAAVDLSLDWLKARGLGSKQVWITEASDKSGDSGQAKGSRYVTFYKELKLRSQVAGVTYFVASASSPDFQKEVWVKGGNSTGIAEVVGSR